MQFHNIIPFVIQNEPNGQGNFESDDWERLVSNDFVVVNTKLTYIDEYFNKSVGA